MRIIFFVCFILCSAGLLNAQPEPCPMPAAMQPTCELACVICDIDGFTGRNDGNFSTFAPDEFCSQGDQRVSWIAFVAGSVDLELDVTVFNCDDGQGLQIGILQTDDCVNFSRATNCDGSVMPGQTATFNNINPLVIGQHYYFIMDGDLGDVCDYTVNVISGSVAVPPLVQGSIINGPEEIFCENVLTEYTVDADPGAVDFLWTLDGAFYSNDVSIQLNLPTQGVYNLCFTASNACDPGVEVCKTINLINDPLVVSLDSPDLNGFNVSCNGLSDGIVNSIASGGRPPYAFSWSNGSTSEDLQNLSAGDYSVTVEDDSGCMVIANISLTEPEVIELFSSVEYIDCAPPPNGNIFISATGGVEPYFYALDASVSSPNNQYGPLDPKEYVINVTDNNGCSDNDIVNIIEFEQVAINLPFEDIILDLGDSLSLGSITNNPANLTFNWAPTEGLDCSNCPEPSFKPVESTQYFIQLTSEQGCSSIDSFIINVNKKRLFYAPNIFSPNGDGINDEFKIHGGPEVAGFTYIRIYSRWGDLVFESTNTVGRESDAWDGNIKSQKLNSGVFTWIAEIEFIDGKSKLHTGDLSIFK